ESVGSVALRPGRFVPGRQVEEAVAPLLVQPKIDGRLAGRIGKGLDLGQELAGDLSARLRVAGQGEALEALVAVLPGQRAGGRGRPTVNEEAGKQEGLALLTGCLG